MASPEEFQKDLEYALEKIEKAQQILSSARMWSVSEVEEETSRADTQLESAKDTLQGYVLEEK